MDPDAIRDAGRVPHGGDDDPAVLDFSANVNPNYPDGVDDVYDAALGESRRYPDDDYPAYREAAAEFVGCAPDAVVPAPGGLAAIRLAIEVAVESGDEVLVPFPSFGEYAREVRLQGAKPRYVPHDEVLDADPDGCALAVVCTPNNPTGEAADPDALQAFARRCADAGATLLVDEAFLGFTDLPSAATVDAENVVVARSLTKLFGLPGLRAGFAVAAGELHTALATARPAWNLGTPAARVGAHCLREEEFVRESRTRVRRERARMRDALAERFDVFPSDAPYLLLDCGDRDVSRLLETTRRNGVAIRDARTFRGLDAHVRVAVRDRDANDRLLEVLLDG